MAYTTTIKSVCTRCRYSLLAEINKAKGYMNDEMAFGNKIERINFGNKCAKMLNCYKDEVEVQMEKLTDAIAENDPSLVVNMVDQDYELLQQAENSLIDLEQF
ncbi:hypothetical protein ACF0H5_005684 [Mactra antiquata]